MEIDRNTIEGFALRVRKNLDFMIVAREDDEDIHIVTQLVCSLLGLIVFPCEHFRRTGFLDFKTMLFEDLVDDGWPKWAFHIGQSESLDRHLSHLRNALSHRRVHFSSDDRSLAGVEVTFWDRAKPEGPDNWSASIDGAGLLDFVERLSTLIDSRS